MSDDGTSDTSLRAWIARSLARRFALGTAFGLVVSSVAFLVLFVGMYLQTLEHEKAAAVGQINSLLRSSLENAMLKRDLDGLRFIVDRLGNQEGIAAVLITNPAGEIRFASDPGAIGRSYGGDWIADLESSTRFLTRDDGREVLRSRVPVRNRAECGECHGSSTANPINGVLYVDYDASALRGQARSTTLALMGSGALIVVLNLTGGWWFIQRYVIRPLLDLGNATEALAGGNLSARANISGSDEIARLGARFDRMAERLEASDQALREHEGFLQELLDGIPDGVRIIGPDFRIVACNRSYRRQAGLSAGGPVGATCYGLSFGRDTPCPPTVVTCPVQELRQRQEPLRTMQGHRRADGGELEVEIYAAPLTLTRAGREDLLVVESLRDLGTQVRYSHEQKLSELGKLAAGVAHEIHNPLASIRFALHAAQAALGGDGGTAEAVEHITLVDREIDRCIGVTERLLRLSMSPPAEPEIVDLNAAVSETLTLLNWEAEQIGVSVALELDPCAPRVLAKDGEVRMIVLNLAQNAFHAMPGGGTLRVRTTRAGDRVQAWFEDTGVGIPLEDHQRIFDPFYSRRADGAPGTGLGLPISRSMARSWHGDVTVLPRKTAGACFVLDLPEAGVSPLFAA